MLFQTITRHFTVNAFLQALKDCSSPIYFRYLLKRPPHARPKIGQIDPRKIGKRFTKPIQEQARKESNHTCVFCGDKTHTSRMMLLSRRSEIDHAHPISRGGTGNIHNAQNTCHDCNAQKNDLTTQEFLVKHFGAKGLKLLRR